MSDDQLLQEALRALRESSDGSSEESPRTRTTLLARASLGARRKRRVMFALMPLAATFIASAAWGAVTGRLPQWLASVGIDGTSTTTARLAYVVPHASTPPTLPTARDADANEAVVAARAASDETAHLAQSTTPPASLSTRANTHVATPSSRSSGQPLVASDTESLLYADAHRAHFVAHDPTAALSAWNAYLASYPQGRFALEARYNRAMSLVRLGRRDEARAALSPFAEGTYGGYRQNEARRLLDALGTTDSAKGGR